METLDTRKKGDIAVIPTVGESLAEDRPAKGKRSVSAIMRWAGCIIDEKSEGNQPKPFTMGSADTAGFIVSEEFCKFPSFEFLTPSDGEWTVNVPDGWEFGYVDKSGVVPADKLEGLNLLRKGGAGAACSFQLTNENAAFFKSGPVQIDVKYIAPKKAIRESFWKSFDKTFSMWLGLSALLMIVIVSVTIIFFKDMMNTPPDDLNKQLNRFTKLIIKAPETKKKEDTPDLKLKTLAETKANFKMDKKTPVKGPNIADPNKREQDRKIALKSGLLGALRGTGGNPAMSSIFGAGGLGSGINNALTGLHGTMIGDSGGLGGLGSRGGGGGGAIGIGGIGTYGAGKSRRGYGDVDLGSGKKGETEISASKLILVGGLEKEVIARIIQRHWAQVKYCYEKELSKNPNLYGKVVVQFTIGASGKVDEGHIAQTEMNNESVEGCIIRNVKMWVFPQPKGGGVVLVTYPFIFKSAGQ
jgi:hypothetical protein